MTLTSEEMKGIIDKFQCELEIYTGLRDLSRGQMTVIDREAGPEELLEILGRKQVLINELEGLERELRPFKEEWSRVRESLPGEVRTQIEQVVRNMQAVLAELLELEEEGRTKLQQRQEQVAAKIREIGRSRQAHHAYAAGQTRPAKTGVIDNTG
ncbi:MAG TPA: hypothetical protein VMZ92_17830 [Planctomycetota bacterium]|nr:hypothetical protein [Planctomycetota bacterium]